MKHDSFDRKLIAARPADTSIDATFTDMVMGRIGEPEILSDHVRRMNVTKKETFMAKLRHLPKLAVVAIAIGALVVITGTTYAVVQTVKTLSNVSVNESGKNEHGREQLKVSFDSCADQNKIGTTYELKRSSNLTADDGQKVIQARCETDSVVSWIENDPQSMKLIGKYPIQTFFMDSANTITSINKDTVTLERGGAQPLTADTRVVIDNKVASLSDVKPGDTVVYFRPAVFTGNNPNSTEGLVLFKLHLPAKYYNLDYQSYVSPRAECMGNPQLTCLKSNNINQTVLIVTYGDNTHHIDETQATKQVQGIVVGYDASSIKLDVGKGLIYTIETPYNVIDKYNTSTVYGLASFDGIYAKTSPEDLKIKVGDSLDVYYGEATDASGHTIPWSEVFTVSLMVERIPNNLDVLRKY